MILFHELGHFLLAKANHVTVLEFAIGMGPKILSFRRGGTDYAWRVLPFGGSCTMLGEDEVEGFDQAGSFPNAALWRRALIIAAGPVFNFIMALVCSMILIGASGASPAIVAEVAEGSPAAEAGLMEGDRIVRYEGNGIANSDELYIDILLSDIPTDEVRLTVERDGEKQKIVYVPQTETSYKLGFYYQDTEDESGVMITRVVKGSPMRKAGLTSQDVIKSLNGTDIHSMEELAAYLEENPMDGTPIDVVYERNGRLYEAQDLVPQEDTQAFLDFSFSMAREKQNFAGWLQYSFGEVEYWIHVVFKSLGSLFNGTFSISEMSGPVGIVETIGDAYEEARPMGALITFLTLLNMITLLSANLGVMNLLPFPALDGGRLLLILIEAIRGKPADPRIESRINYVGLMVLMVLMVYITIHDVMRLF